MDNGSQAKVNIVVVLGNRLSGPTRRSASPRP